ncbi:SDR family oxidoreductase [Mycetocola spongiae]|uniref:SDR family oxidoreductase n=1 Tax=Mycetocola spongiae TaxID=2859226 RepID=UPI001CF4BA59|nr:SDR family oxidoreductase [Mycetocola spongiae]UCR89943.1 SDR family oxidoreductase [Mycetocola spongiae]
MGKGTRLHGATVVVTGAGSGIGRLMALGAARRGARVIIWDLSAERGEAVRDEILGRGGRAHSAVVNVANREAVEEAARAVLSDIGAVDVLINNAGVVTGKPLLEADPASIQRTMDVNATALFWTTRAFLPGMIERQRGSIVTIASAAGFVAVARQTDYSASKFAAVGFTEALRAELRAAGDNVHTLLVCPYYIDTGMFAGVRTRFPLLLPILQESAVALRILDSIEAGRAQIMLPRTVRLVSALRLLPVALSDRLLDFAGLNRGMDHFTGRAAERKGTEYVS